MARCCALQLLVDERKTAEERMTTVVTFYSYLAFSTSVTMIGYPYIIPVDEGETPGGVDIIVLRPPSTASGLTDKVARKLM